MRGYRAWDVANKEMLYPDGNGYFGSEHHLSFVIDGNGKPIYIDDMGTPVEIIFLQYIGRKDKNCKEIYEGDVVLFDYDGIEESDPCRIYWSDGDMGWVLHSNNEEWGDRLNEFVSADLRIIGNIYENPDLLKEQS